MKTTASKDTVLTAIDRVNRSENMNLELGLNQRDDKFYYFSIKKSPNFVNTLNMVMDEIFNIEPKSIVYVAGIKLSNDSRHIITGA